MDKDAAQLDFLNRIQRILNEGSFVASYKYALLMSIAELCVEKADAADGSLHLPLRDIAERFVGLYWRQAGPFGGNAFLRHNTGREAEVITLVRGFRELAPTLPRAKRHPQWNSLITAVSRVLRKMPLWKLQTVGSEKMDFLYQESLVDGGIVLRPGISDCFRHQFTVIQALIQMAWLSFIQRIAANKNIIGPSGDLAEFLFGSDRNSLTVLVPGLRDLQKGNCFYCRHRLHKTVEVDHFIPRARYPLDLGHNFVLSHSACNRNKRDMLAAPLHLEHWLQRNDSQGSVLAEVFAGTVFQLDLDASMTVVEWQYELAERSGALVWVKGNETERLGARWREEFSRR